MEQGSGMWLGIMIGIAVMVGVGIGVEGADPDLVTDFNRPLIGIVDRNLFTFKGFSDVVKPNWTATGTFKATRAFKSEFPMLSGLGVSYAFLQFGPDSINPLHAHPRASELLVVLSGCLTVGFVDTMGNLFQNTLLAGDMFVFPKGMLHYQINLDKHNQALALSAFGSANPGTISLPSTLFGSGISDIVLKKSFKISHQTLDELQAPFV